VSSDPLNERLNRENAGLRSGFRRLNLHSESCLQETHAKLLFTRKVCSQRGGLLFVVSLLTCIGFLVTMFAKLLLAVIFRGKERRASSAFSLQKVVKGTCGSSVLESCARRLLARWCVNTLRVMS
jgi:hypothetical protein